MEFKNPPVIEAWIEFKLDLTEESIAWDRNLATDFITKYCPGFNPADFLEQQQIKVDAKTRTVTEIQSSFERIRAFDEGKQHCIQAGRNILIFNQIKKTSWLGFNTLRDGAFEALKKFLEFRRLNKLTAIGLHYRDLVEIPSSENENIELEDYFRIYPKCPETEIKGISYFNLNILLLPVSAGENIKLSIESTSETSDTGKFQFDWHIEKQQSFENLDIACTWLNNASNDLKNMFTKVFTKKCLEIFQPKEC